MFEPLIIPFAFVLGFTLARASTCTVAATKRWVYKGKTDWFVGIMVAVSWSGVTLLVLKMLSLSQSAGSLTSPLSVTMFVAAIIMGLGAYLNNGCFIGSIGRISGGDTTYLMSFVGLVMARIIGNHDIFVPLLEPQNQLREPVMALAIRWLLLVLFVTLSGYGIVRALRTQQQAIIALCFMGVFAALTYASNPGWSYEAWIGRVIGGQGVSGNLYIELAILALFSGAIISRILNGNFAFRAPNLPKMILCFFGGILMGLGAMFVPGGNDTLLLWAIPNFALHGLVAYLIMVLTVAALIYARERLF